MSADHSFVIRPATEADVPRMHELILKLAEYERLRECVTATADDLHAALFGESSCAEALVAEESAGETPIAVAIFFTNYSTFTGRPGLYLEDIFVEESARGRGVGRGLLVALAKLAHERECGRLDWAVLDWNQNAIDFYTRLGADILPDWRIVRLDQAGIERLAKSVE